MANTTENINIYLSVPPELKRERSEILAFIDRVNSDNNNRYYLSTIVWEEFLTTKEGPRELYNAAITKADIAIMVFHNRIGNFSREEFNFAIANYKKTGRPLLYIYFKESPTTSLPQENESLLNFKETLINNAFYSSVFYDSEELLVKIEYELKRFTIKSINWREIIIEEKESKSGKLDLSACNLSEIPSDLLELDWLEELNISNNKIEHIEHLENLINLRKLDLYRNNIVKIQGLEKNTNLSWIGLSANKIEKLENISHLEKLQKIYIAHNRLTEIEVLDKLPKLRRIVLTGNRINSLKPLLSKIENGLQIVLQYSFSDDEEGVYIKDNPLSEPSIEVIESGTEAIIKYFEDSLKYGQRKLEILKFILVGNSRVGKTNFSEFIRTGEITVNNNSTHLLDIQTWDAPFLTSEEGTLTRVHIFDFGGQDYYHDSHRMYYSHDTAYILLWDTETNKYYEKEEPIPETNESVIYENFPLPYWLESINFNLEGKYQSTYRTESSTMSASNTSTLPPILIIQNKIDKGQGVLNQETLSSKYKNIWGYFSLSLEQKKRTGILNELLSDYLYALNLSGRRLVLYQMKVIEHYLANQHDFEVITLEDFTIKCREIIADNNLTFTKTDAQIIAYILNNTGIALYDKTGEEDGIVYTNIMILNYTIKEIMDIAKKGNDQGIFHKDQIVHIPHTDKVLDLLSKNNSIIAINENEFLTPQFLPVKPDRSIEFFLYTFKYNQLRFVYKAYFHKSLLLNLFAEYLKDKKLDTSLGIKSFPFWRNGIIITTGDGPTKQMVLVEFLKTTESGIINVRTMTPFNNQGLEKEVENTLDKLNKGWTVEKEISSDSTNFFNLDFLREQASGLIFEFTKGNKKYGINDFKQIAEFANLPKRIFLSYSSRNADFVKRFVIHLEILKTSGQIDPWYDRMIEPGSRWDDTIKAELQKADIVIFLLSPDFIATKYVFEVEIPQAIEQMKSAKTKLFFVELQPCSWEKTIIRDFQQTDDPQQPEKNIISLGQSTNDAGWKKVIDRLESLLSKT